jgi:mannosyltransferase
VADGAGRSTSPEHKSQPRLEVFTVALLTAMSGLLLLIRLDATSFWFDEALSFRLAGLPLADFVAMIRGPEGNMVLYHVLLRGWISLSTTDWWVRALSVIPAVATIPLLYLLGRRAIGSTGGLLAAVLLIANPFFFDLAREARGYSLVTFLVTLATCLLVRATERRDLISWMAYILTIVLSVYAHFVALLVLASHVFWVCIVRGPQLPMRRLLAYLGLITLGVGPALVYISRRPGQLSHLVEPGLDLATLTAASLLGGSEELVQQGPRLLGTPLSWVLAAAVGVAILGGLSSLLLPGRTRSLSGLYALCALAPAVILFVVSQTKPVFRDRYLILSLPFLLLLGAQGLALFNRGGKSRPSAAFAVAAIVIVLLGMRSVASCYSACERQDWRGVVSYVNASGTPGDAIVFERAFAFVGFRHYGEKHASDLPTLIRPRVSWHDPGINFPDVLPHTFFEIARQYSRIWVVVSMGNEYSPALIAELQQGREVEERRRFRGIRVLRLVDQAD